MSSFICSFMLSFFIFFFLQRSADPSAPWMIESSIQHAEMNSKLGSDLRAGDLRSELANGSSTRLISATERDEMDSVKSSAVLIIANSTVVSENKTFELGFFSTNDHAKWYLGIWYASITTPTYVWVANRDNPVVNLSSARAEMDADGTFLVVDWNKSVRWRSNNKKQAMKARLLESGNLVLVSSEEEVVWQSFDFPSDTWLPGMNMTSDSSLICWRSSSDPSPGMYSLRLRPPEYGEFELVYNFSEAYWSTGNWTGDAFAGIPEMTVPYIYTFFFLSPFTSKAVFGYSVVEPENGLRPPLTRFRVDPVGQLQQFTWSSQTGNWYKFWFQPEDQCGVYGLCGSLGFCSRDLHPCFCMEGFTPNDNLRWTSGDYSAGCRREDNQICNRHDKFQKTSSKLTGGYNLSFSGGFKDCKASCLLNCSCLGFYHNSIDGLCRSFHGTVLNLALSENGVDFYLRVGRYSKPRREILFIVIGCVVGLVFMIIVLSLFRRRSGKNRRETDLTCLKVFSYEELNSATIGFKDKLGHGGFGEVFRGELPDSSMVAVKRLQRHGSGGEREFRAEVCTIGSIHHVNLVRLRGFCTEESHRLLVYEYLQNGSLGSYLSPDGSSLSWETRLGIAVGTARGIAYLHEGCRHCIIHCDIKPENILLDAKFSPKISDFGLAKLVGREFSRVMATMRGTRGYVAPEWISGVAITPKVDVYSFGMTLLELLSGRRNMAEHAEMSGSCEGFFPPWAVKHIAEGDVDSVVDRQLGGAYCVAEAQRVARVAVWCLQDDENVRPEMGMVVKMLEGVLEVLPPAFPMLLQALVSGDSFRGITSHGNELSASSQLT